MRGAGTFFSLAVLLAAEGFTPCPLSATQRETAIQTQQDAISDPFDDEKFKKYVASLPRDGLLYIVEGDLLLSERELRPYLTDKASAPTPSGAQPELLISVNKHEGTLDYWKDPSTRELTYAVERNSFPSEDLYKRVLKNMTRAGHDWETVCPACKVHFTHRKEWDTTPSHDKVVFIVRYHDVRGAYIAAAFFPHDAPELRYLNIDPSYFSTTFDHVGVLRHELGHVLGYRHEHTRGVTGCYYEDDDWQALTAYDPHSVMHYFCGRQGTLRLDLTEVDKKGHRALYGIPPPNTSSSDAPPAQTQRGSASDTGSESIGTLTVRFEGGEIARNAAHTLATLSEGDVIRSADEEHTVKKGDSICSIYQHYTEFPGGCAAEILQLASQLNRKKFKGKNSLKRGQQIRYPNVKFVPYRYNVRLSPEFDEDKQQLQNIQTHWKTKGVEQVQRSNGVQQLTLDGYKLEIPITHPEQATSALQLLDALKLPNVLYDVRTTQKQNKTLYGRIAPSSHFQQCVSGTAPHGQEGWFTTDVGTDETELPSCAKQCTHPPCPVVVLMDTPVYLHRDFAPERMDGAILRPPGATTDGVSNEQCKQIHPFVRKQHHGTHLASIIVSQANGFGFVGVGPAAQLYSHDWQSSNRDALGDFINRRMSSSSLSPQVFLFASEWSSWRGLDSEERRYMPLNNEKDRFALTVATRIRDLHPLWVTAAGQWDRTESPEGHPLNISRETATGPMNLGDLSNVIVVTACDDCSDQHAQLMINANHSRDHKLVHIAAPGKDIPGAATAVEYCSASGTSQAAAFVAGTAAAMLGCYPQYYNNRPDRVKTRLQVTSRPVLVGDDNDKIATGILDMGLALQDPVVTRLMTLEGPRSVMPKHWCVDNIDLQDPVNGGEVEDWHAKVENIYRIVRYRRARPDEPKQWVIYKRRGRDVRGRNHEGEVIKIGPGVWDPNAKLIKLEDRENPLTLDDIEDLLLDQPLQERKPC